MRITKRAIVVLGAMVLMLTGVFASGAQAAGPQPVGVPHAVPATSVISPMANWDCPSGNICVWTGSDGNGSRCNWSDADSDWQSGSIVCSWSGSTKVQSVFNNGTSSSFTGVQVYRNANFGSPFFCAPQGDHTRWIITNGGVLLRSHQWIRSAC